MQIEYLTTKSKRDVPEAIGKELVRRKIAKAVYETRQLKPEAAPEISERTGRPKRQYRRRDMQAEE